VSESGIKGSQQSFFAPVREDGVALSWTIGKVKITRIVESQMAFDPAILAGEASREGVKAIPWLVPHYLDSQGRLIMSYQAFVVEAPGVTLVVDTCVGNDKERGFAPHSRLATAFLVRLAEAGFSRENVDIVICTHMHYDHVGWNTMLEADRWVPTFPRARYLFARKEYEHWTRDLGPEVMAQSIVLADSINPVFEFRLAQLVETEHRISNELQLVPTPGHTPGHVSLAISSEGTQAVITGDSFLHPCQVAHPDWVAPHEVDPVQVIATRRQLLDRCVRSAGLLIGTHFPAPTAGHVQCENNAYRFEGLSAASHVAEGM
jgi:glyoxylase-like metal-dependent hydrolase (beta-lactamase superfamily II)